MIQEYSIVRPLVGSIGGGLSLTLADALTRAYFESMKDNQPIEVFETGGEVTRRVAIVIAST